MDPDSPFGVLLECIQKNGSLLDIDLRQCNIPSALELKLTSGPKHRALALKGINLEAYASASTRLQVTDTVKSTEIGDKEGENIEAKNIP